MRNLLISERLSRSNKKQALGHSTWRCIMADRTQDYFDDNDNGHVDTRERNFECENKDEHLGCNGPIV
jgi:hypothetical protein